MCAEILDDEDAGDEGVRRFRHDHGVGLCSRLNARGNVGCIAEHVGFLAAAFIAGKRFSLRSFLLGEEQGLAPGLVMPLKSFLYEVMTGLREIEPALSAARLRT